MPNHLVAPLPGAWPTRLLALPAASPIRPSCPTATHCPSAAKLVPNLIPNHGPNFDTRTMVSKGGVSHPAHPSHSQRPKGLAHVEPLFPVSLSPALSDPATQDAHACMGRYEDAATAAAACLPARLEPPC